MRICICLALLTVTPYSAFAADESSPDSARILEAMKRATAFFTDSVSVRGGYVYTVSVDLQHREGEGRASPTEIWVQPPGTPAVGQAFLDAFAATQDQQFLRAARRAASALIFGQLDSGGWTDRVDFDPQGRRTGRYRSGRGNPRGRNYSTLDDDKSQAALRFLMRLDQLTDFRDAELHESVQFALEALLKAQFANGGFPQGWDRPVEPGPITTASFPDYDWRTEGRFKNYWDFETLNDGLAGTVTRTLHQAAEVYEDQRFHKAMLAFGEFLIRAQLPEPQPAWAQQYNHQLQPIWARKFEPPAVAGRESEDVIETLLQLTEWTGDERFLKPVPAALDWLRRSQVADGQIARFYELKSNRPLYFVRDTYELTYDDSRVPTHYSFRSRSGVKRLQRRLELIRAGTRQQQSQSFSSLQRQAHRVLQQLDEQGRWVTDGSGKPVNAKASADDSKLQLESNVFCQNLSLLANCFTAVTERETQEKPSR